MAYGDVPRSRSRFVWEIQPAATRLILPLGLCARPNGGLDLQQAENRKCICAVVTPDHESGDQHLPQNLLEFIPVLFQHIESFDCTIAMKPRGDAVALVELQIVCGRARGYDFVWEI
jgi:hypothetical protein